MIITPEMVVNIPPRTEEHTHLCSQRRPVARCNILTTPVLRKPKVLNPDLSLQGNILVLTPCQPQPAERMTSGGTKAYSSCGQDRPVSILVSVISKRRYQIPYCRPNLGSQRQGKTRLMRGSFSCFPINKVCSFLMQWICRVAGDVMEHEGKCRASLAQLRWGKQSPCQDNCLLSRINAGRDPSERKGYNAEVHAMMSKEEAWTKRMQCLQLLRGSGPRE